MRNVATGNWNFIIRKIEYIDSTAGCYKLTLRVQRIGAISANLYD